MKPKFFNLFYNNFSDRINPYQPTYNYFQVLGLQARLSYASDSDSYPGRNSIAMTAVMLVVK